MASVLFLLVLVLLLFTGSPGNDSGSIDVRSGGSVTIPCRYQHKYKYHVKYWCKGDDWKSCSIMVRSDSPQSEGEVSITDVPDQLIFYATMRNLQKKDTGYYGCGVDSTGSAEDWFSKVHITVSTGTKGVWTESWRSVQRGASVTIPCRYDRKHKDHVKYWCTGYHWTSCTTMVRTDSPQRKGEVSITDDPDQLVFNVTMRNLREMDSDWYQCGVDTERSSTEHDLSALYLLVTTGQTVTTSVTMSVTKSVTTSSPTALTKEKCQTTNPQSPSTLLIVLLLVALLLLLLSVSFVICTWIRHKKRKETHTTHRDGGNRRTPASTEDHVDEVTYSTAFYKGSAG